MPNDLGSKTLTTTNEYVTLITITRPLHPQKLLFRLKENNVNAVKVKIEGAMEVIFADPVPLLAEVTIAKNGGRTETLTDPWLYVRVQHKADVADTQGNTTVSVSGD